MECVDGHGPMVERRVVGQLVDQCATCQGLWLDPGELWRALGRPVSDEDQIRRVLSFEGLNMARDCPRCTTPLSNAMVGEVVISACMDCSGLWLDEAAAARLRTYTPRPTTLTNEPTGRAVNAVPMPVHGAGPGQTQAMLDGVGEAMEALVEVLFSVVDVVTLD